MSEKEAGQLSAEWETEFLISDITKQVSFSENLSNAPGVNEGNANRFSAPETANSLFSVSAKPVAAADRENHDFFAMNEKDIPRPASERGIETPVAEFSKAVVPSALVRMANLPITEIFPPIDDLTNESVPSFCTPITSTENENDNISASVIPPAFIIKADDIQKFKSNQNAGYGVFLTERGGDEEYGPPDGMTEREWYYILENESGASLAGDLDLYEFFKV